MEKILITGSDGRFGKVLKKIKSKKKLVFTNKKNLNILSPKSIVKNLVKYKPKYILHLAGLSRPMNIHEKNISKSIDLNIIGTCNLVKEAEKKKIKLIYLSTNYVYPGLKGNYKENDALRIKTAKRRQKKYFKYFSSKILSRYLIEKTFDINLKQKYLWDK